MAENEIAVELINVRKMLDRKAVLNGLSISVKRGETLAVIGGSGEGKTVTLKIIVGLMKPDSGMVKVGGMDITNGDNGALYSVRRKIGFLFQGAALLNSINVAENVALPLREHERLSEAEISDKVAQALSLVGLSGVERKMTSALSGGMRKRVGIARAIVREPEIIFYDEPSSGLDPVTTSVINDLIVDMKQKLGITSIVVTHDIASAIRTADRIAMLHRGRIIRTGVWNDFIDSDDPVVRQFISGASKGPLTETVAEV